MLFSSVLGAKQKYWFMKKIQDLSLREAEMRLFVVHHQENELTKPCGLLIVLLRTLTQ